MKMYGKPRYPPPKKPSGPSDAPSPSGPSLQSKLVLLTLTFPRLRIIWTSSPYATSEIFNDLKSNNPEPDATKAITIGADNDSEVGAGVNTTAEEVLRCIPGITASNVKMVMNKVTNLRAFCDMSLLEVEKILGVDAGKAAWSFMHKGDL